MRHRADTVLVIAGITLASMTGGEAVAATVIDMPPPPSASPLQSVVDTEGSKGIDAEIGRLALARYAHARHGPRNVIDANRFGRFGRRSFGHAHWPFGAGLLFPGFGHFHCSPFVVISHPVRD